MLGAAGRALGVRRGRRVSVDAHHAARRAEQDTTRHVGDLEHGRSGLAPGRRDGGAGLRQQRPARRPQALGHLVEFVGDELVDAGSTGEQRLQLGDLGEQSVALGLELDA